MKKIKNIRIISLFISCIIILSCANISIISASDLQTDSDLTGKCKCCEDCDCGNVDGDCINCEDCNCLKSGDVSDVFDEEFIELKESKKTEKTNENQGITVNQLELGIKAEGAILIEADTGIVLYEQNADEAFPPASVTKIMSLLLIMEGIDEGRISLDDKVSVSEYASSMGGSQVFLAPGEEMSMDDMLKAIVISSANDATVAVAEHLMGSVDAFVSKMNERAKELGMENTVFKNTTGLDEDGHVISSRDIAIMSRELIKHKKIFDYTTIWMDTLRNGEFGLSNTNRLIRFYSGANGLKTGSTSIAKYCLSASALRNDMQLIAVVMGAPSSDERFAGAKKMLDYGFATYAVYKVPQEELAPVRVTGGVNVTVKAIHATESFLINKGKEKSIEKQIVIADSVAAPIDKGQKIGTINYTIDGNIIKSVNITAAESIERISFWGIFGKMAKKYFLIN